VLERERETHTHTRTQRERRTEKERGKEKETEREKRVGVEGWWEGGVGVTHRTKFGIAFEESFVNVFTSGLHLQLGNMSKETIFDERGLQKRVHSTCNPKHVPKKN